MIFLALFSIPVFSSCVRFVGINALHLILPSTHLYWTSIVGIFTFHNWIHCLQKNSQCSIWNPWWSLVNLTARWSLFNLTAKYTYTFYVWGKRTMVTNQMASSNKNNSRSEHKNYLLSLIKYLHRKERATLWFIILQKLLQQVIMSYKRITFGVPKLNPIVYPKCPKLSNSQCKNHTTLKDLRFFTNPFDNFKMFQNSKNIILNISNLFFIWISTLCTFCDLY